ncbi:Origin recognition complex subunit 5, partial [Sarracenia purpurea var. burkii]
KWQSGRSTSTAKATPTVRCRANGGNETGEVASTYSGCEKSSRTGIQSKVFRRRRGGPPPAVFPSFFSGGDRRYRGSDLIEIQGFSGFQWVSGIWRYRDSVGFGLKVVFGKPKISDLIESGGFQRRGSPMPMNSQILYILEDMGKEESPQVTRRTTRSSTPSTPSFNKFSEPTKASNLHPMTLKGRFGKSSSKNRAGRINGKMVYWIIDNLELVREWDKSATILPFLFKMYDILMMPEVGLIYISKTSPDTYYSDTGYVVPIPVYFPDYTEEDLRQIFMRKKANPKLYSSFLDVVLKPFCRITRRVDELSAAFFPLFKKYCEPLSDLGISPSEGMKRRLFSHLQPHIMGSLSEVFKVASLPSYDGETNKEKAKHKSNTLRLGGSQTIEVMDFHMSISAKYLLISAFLASKNPATLDASMFDSIGGSDSRKRKRKSSEKSMERKEATEQELLMKGPGTFPLERLLVIFQCITSVAENSLDEEQGTNEFGVESGDTGLMSDVLLQLSSLCNANFISKGGSCPLEGSTRYRSTVSEDMALKVARSLKFPLSKYLYRR